MRKLTEQDVDRITGGVIEGYQVLDAKIKQGLYIDSDHYGFILGQNARGQYVTWQFYLLDDESVSVHWGNYILDREEVLRDFMIRSTSSPQWFDVTVTGMLQLVVRVKAHSRQKAEQIVFDDWKKQEFVLGPECFAGVEFQSEPTDK